MKLNSLGGSVIAKAPAPQPEKQRLSVESRQNIELLCVEMRSFYRVARKVEKITNPEKREKTQNALELDENAQWLFDTYKYDQREDRLKNKERAGKHSRGDMAEYFEETREAVNRSVVRHLVAYEVVGLALSLLRRLKDGAAEIGLATALGAVEFFARNERLNRMQDRAERGWKKVQEYSGMDAEPYVDEMRAVSTPAQPKNGTAAGDKKEKIESRTEYSA